MSDDNHSIPDSMYIARRTDAATVRDTDRAIIRDDLNDYTHGEAMSTPIEAYGDIESVFITGGFGLCFIESIFAIMVCGLAGIAFLAFLEYKNLIGW